MKPVNLKELEILHQHLCTCIGHSLEKIFFDDKTLVLKLNTSSLSWVVFDLEVQSPQILLLNYKPQLQKTKNKNPITHFLKAHFINQKIKNIFLLKEQGRVLKIEFSEGFVEFVLVPHAQNLSVFFNEKTVFWFKPIELKSKLSPLYQSKKIRGFEELKEEWEGKKLTLSASKKKQNLLPQEVKKFLSSRIKKEEKILDKIQKEIKNKKDIHELHKDLTKQLQQFEDIDSKKRSWYTEQSLDRKKYLSKDLSKHQNIDRLFQAIKKHKEKIKILEIKYKEISKNINLLKEGLTFSETHFFLNMLKPFFFKQSGFKQSDFKQAIESAHSLEKDYKTWMQEAISRGFFKDLSRKSSSSLDALNSLKVRYHFFESPSGFRAFSGKSAQQNMALLKWARPWYYWLHLRDYPSSHCYIERNKNQVVPEGDLHLIAKWLVKKTFKQKKISKDLKFEVVVVECRFVRKIKGDRLGRVSYKNEKNFLIS